MNIIEILLIGLSLSMDAFSLSIVMSIKNNSLLNGLTVSLFFGIFQFLMPILGFYLGNVLSQRILNYHGYLSSLLLLCIGILILTEKSNNEHTTLNIKELFILSIATSIDAFIVGISFSFLDTNIFLSSIIIGIITFVICSIGYFLGHLFSKKIHQYANIIGGITLIILSIKILLENLL